MSYSFLMKTVSLSICLFATLLFHSCKKNETENADQEAKIDRVSGNIILPSGSNINLNALVVNSPIDTSGVNGGKYNINAYVSEPSTLLVINPTGNVVLMGYIDPNDTSRAISVHSTALALVMSTPATFAYQKKADKI